MDCKPCNDYSKLTPDEFHRRCVDFLIWHNIVVWNRLQLAPWLRIYKFSTDEWRMLNLLPSFGLVY